jgi:hypothetical protein
MPARALPPVEIKQFELADEEALLAFLREAFADEPRKSDPAVWRWQYLDHPYVGRGDVPLWVVKSEGRIVGQLPTIPVRLKVGAESTRALWLVDGIVSTAFHGRALMTRLMRTALESCPIVMGLGIARSVPLYKRLRAQPLGHLHRYQKLLFPGNAVRELAGRRLLRGFANLAYAPFRPRVREVTVPEVTVGEVEGFDASFDDLWREAAPQWTCAVERDRQVLDWQFRRQPGKHFHILTLRRDGRLAGYAVLFFRKGEHGHASPKASIADLLYGPSDPAGVIGSLLDASLRLAIERRAGSLVIDIRDDRVERELARRGFWRIKKAPEFRAIARVHQTLVNEPANWFLTRADSDVSIFESANL